MAVLTGIPEDEWVQAPLAPGFYRPCASRRTMGSAHRAGWFRGEFYMPPTGGYILIARRAIPSPLNPLNLLNPLNPHAAGVSNGETTTLSYAAAVKL